MPIATGNNVTYGPPLVSQKYSPLSNVGYLQADTPVYSALLTNRPALLQHMNLWPQSLGLVVPNTGPAPQTPTEAWKSLAAAEAGHLPPLVVVSSNRSGWIAQGNAAAILQLQTFPPPLPSFANASDLTALTARAGQAVSPPIYCSARLGPAPKRNVYVVVHAREYLTYKTALANTGMTVVGWQFRLPPNWPNPSLAGFGASRFAAIEFCKQLRTLATPAGAGGKAPWNYAWLFDDNVVALTNFPGYAAVEAAMTATDACAGFSGGTVAQTQPDTLTWAKDQIAEGRGGQAANLPTLARAGILQQAVLWNIAYLKDNFLNFGPIYVASAEDVSIGRYFDNRRIPYRYYPAIGVRKEITGSDDGRAADAVNVARNYYAGVFAAAESAGVAGALPPPVMVQPPSPNNAVQTLASFVVNTVLPNSLIHAQAGDANVRANAQCQAVEQLSCGAIGAGFVLPTALATTFQINGETDQAVFLQSVP